MWKRITVLLCMAILLTSCSGSIHIEIGPPLEGQVRLGPFGSSKRFFPVIEGEVVARNNATYREYYAYPVQWGSEYFYRLGGLPAGNYRIRAYSLLGYDDRYIAYPQETSWSTIDLGLPWHFKDELFVQLGGMQYLIGRDYRGEPIYSAPQPMTRWAGGTIYYYFDGFSSTGRNRIRSILSKWQSQILNIPSVGSVVKFQETQYAAGADLIFFEERAYQAEGVLVERSRNSSGYLTRVYVRFNHWTPDTATCNYGIALAMGMGNSPDPLSVLHWEYRSGQLSDLTSREEDYARVMYSIPAGLQPRYGGYGLYADGLSAVSTDVDFELLESTESNTVVIGK